MWFFDSLPNSLSFQIRVRIRFTKLDLRNYLRNIRYSLPRGIILGQGTILSLLIGEESSVKCCIRTHSAKFMASFNLPTPTITECHSCGVVLCARPITEFRHKGL